MSVASPRLTLALLALAPLGPALASTATTPPIETIIVVGQRAAGNRPDVSTITPPREGRLSTLDDLFRGAPGLLVEPVFGGVDHPRFAIRGSGLQRGTQPAGRGIDLRLNGLPMTYADSSFDFVEWVEPLAIGEVRVLRGGRGARAAAGALGGIVDFRDPAPAPGASGLARGEGGSFGRRRAQGLVSVSEGRGQGFLSVSGYGQQGFRDFNAQSAAHANAGGRLALSDAVTMRTGFLWSESRLELPGPQTLAEINAGSRAAQPGNVRGDWRRRAERVRASAGLGLDFGATRLDLDAAFLTTDVDFRRRDVQLERSEDWSARARLAHDLPLGGQTATLGADIVWQQGGRRQRLYLNGGGTIPSFTGTRTLLWADNDLTAERLTAVALASLPLGDRLTADLAAGGSWNRRRISDNVPTRPARPEAAYARNHSAVIASGVVDFAVRPGFSLFLAGNRVAEAPTFDMLLTNVMGMGSGEMLVNGANPRRPVINALDQQRMTSVEAGGRGRLGPVELDVTLFTSWLAGEIVSTADFVAQVVSSVGNADRTRRVGIEAAAAADLARPRWQAGDRLRLGASWTFIDARFAADPTWGNNRLPVQPPHVIELRLDYDAPRGLFAGAAMAVVPKGGYADYANTLRDDGRAVVGLRAGWRGERLTAFIDARNLGNARYASTVIAAQNNLGGRDAAAFAPGEARGINGGIELAF